MKQNYRMKKCLDDACPGDIKENTTLDAGRASDQNKVWGDSWRLRPRRRYYAKKDRSLKGKSVCDTEAMAHRNGCCLEGSKGRMKRDPHGHRFGWRQWICNAASSFGGAQSRKWPTRDASANANDLFDGHHSNLVTGRGGSSFKLVFGAR